MTTTVGELIERLKKFRKDEVVLCNLYSVANLRDCIWVLRKWRCA